MRIFINITDEWMEKYVLEAQEYLKDYVKIDYGSINFDATNKVFYENVTFWDKHVLRKRSAIKSSVIKALGQVFGGKYDAYGIIVDKKDTYRAGVPLRDRGLYDPTLNTLQVYGSKSRRNVVGHKETTSHIIHEILHAMSDYRGKTDVLHPYLKRAGDYEGYLNYLKV